MVSFVGQPTVNTKRWGAVPMATATKFAPLLAAEGQYDENVRAGQTSSRLSNPNIYGPFGSQQITWNPDGTVSINRSLSAGEQGLYDENTRIRQQMAGIGGSSLDRLASNYGRDFDTSNLPGRVTNVQLGDILSRLDTSGLPQIPGADDLGKFRQQAQDAAYRRNTEYLDPQFQRAEADTRTRLANQGITEGSEAWNRDWRDLGDTKQRAYDSARAGAIEQGLAEQRAQFGMGSDARAQLFGELLSGGQFRNQAEGQAFDQRLANADLANTGRAAQFEENAYLRDLPLRELQALMPQYNTPEFQNFQGQQVQPMDLEGAVRDIIGLQQQQDAAKKMRSNQLLGAGINLAGSLGGGWLAGR